MISIQRSGRKGIALIMIVLLIMIMAIIALNISSFITYSVRLNAMKLQEDKAYYAAQGGIARIFYAMTNELNPRWVKLANLSVGTNVYVDIGRDANFLKVNCAEAEIAENRIVKITLTNLYNEASIRVTTMKFEWAPNPELARLIEIKINGITIWGGPDGAVTAQSGDTINVDYNFPNGANYTDNSLLFTGLDQIAAPTVMATFTFNDGSYRKALILKDGHPGNCEFSITSTGRVEAYGRALAKRTVEATYDSTGCLTSWQKDDTHI